MKFTEIYREQAQNSNLAASASEQFVISSVNRSRYGSGNSLILSSRDDNQLNVYLDDNNIFAILQPNGSVIIKPEDGIFFDSVKIENLGADQTDANKITIRMARAEML